MSTALVSPMFSVSDVFPKSISTRTKPGGTSPRYPVGEPLSRRGSNPASAAPTSADIPISGSHHRRLDRSYSEPVERVKSSNINSNRYKTELCRPFEESGTCKYADKCQFAHGVHELRSVVRHPKYKTELCRTFHTSGFCSYGHRCNFIHNANEERAKLQATMVRGLGGLGSTAESPSPPSSVSGSPSSALHDYFDSDDAFFNPPATVLPSFAFPQELSTPPMGKQHRPLAQSYSVGSMRLGSVGELLASSPSPVESLGSDLDNLSISASPPLPTEEIDTSPARLRLPVFSNLA